MHLLGPEIFRVQFFQFPWVMGRHGTSWDLMGRHGTSWDLMGRHGTSWDVMGRHGTSWDVMGCHGSHHWSMIFNSAIQEQLMDKLTFTSPTLAQQIRRIDAVDGRELTLRNPSVSQIVGDDALDRARRESPNLGDMGNGLLYK